MNDKWKSKFEIITDGLVYSRHATYEDAEGEIVRVANQTMIEIEVLSDEINEKKEFIESLRIFSIGSQGRPDSFPAGFLRCKLENSNAFPFCKIVFDLDDVKKE